LGRYSSSNDVSSSSHIPHYHASNTSTACVGRDSILNTKFKANWAFIQQRKQEIIARNNERENASCIKYTYTPNDKVMYKNVMDSKFSEDPWKGP
jgi:Bacterial SH3 domain